MTNILLAIWGIFVLGIIGYGFYFICKDIKKSFKNNEKQEKK